MLQFVQEKWICTGCVSPMPVPLSTAFSHHPAVTVVCHTRSAWLSQPYGTAWLKSEVITEQGVNSLRQEQCKHCQAVWYTQL